MLGTWCLGILAGHNRYAHITGLRGDGLSPQLLGMKGLVSEDSLRRALERMSAKQSQDWLAPQLLGSVQAALDTPWILSMYESESQGDTVPEDLSVEVTSTTCRMRGTDHAPPRCAALTGHIGVNACCGIYEWRPSPCQELEMGSDACERARARHGLPRLGL